MTINEVTQNLAPYPMEELARIRQQLRDKGKPVFDFGTGDPEIPTWQPIIDALVANIPKISQYPGIRGIPALRKAHADYLMRNFGVTATQMTILPTRGSKESIFHIALSVVGRLGRRRIIYPDPGYPVYRSSILFAGGIPHPVKLGPENNYLLEPWKLSEKVQQESAAIWINYPHNPTGATAPKGYLRTLVEWAHKNDVIILSDECYVDIYNNIQSVNTELPHSILEFDSEKSIAFFSLSKRSGMTGYRCGFMAGAPTILEKHAVARANFGVAVPDFVQHAAIAAWSDDTHVADRRKIFADRLQLMANGLKSVGLEVQIPNATFYLWVKVPPSYRNDDVEFALKLAEEGVITSPSSWLSEEVFGYVRFAMVPGETEIEKAIAIVKNFVCR